MSKARAWVQDQLLGEPSIVGWEGTLEMCHLNPIFPGDGRVPDALLSPGPVQSPLPAPAGVKGLWDSGVAPVVSRWQVGSIFLGCQEASAIPAFWRLP